jgi:hypothetical protein
LYAKYATVIAELTAAQVGAQANTKSVKVCTIFASLFSFFSSLQKFPKSGTLTRRMRAAGAVQLVNSNPATIRCY